MPIEKLRPSFSFDEERIKQLKQIAPEAFADNQVNWEVLKEALGNYFEEDDLDVEHFGLFWPGKREARRMASIPSKGTLVPCPGEGIDEENTRNIFIEGENLEVLKILQKSYAGRIKMIYIDPPYNTGNDFVYDDDFTEPLEEYLRRTGQIDGEGKPLTTNKKADGRFHSKWLSMMYPRLKISKNLLREDGVIFVSIDDNELQNLKSILNEIFGEENYRNTFIVRRYDKNINRQFIEQGLVSFNTGFEYILCFSKSEDFSFDGIYREADEDRKNNGYWKGFWNNADRPTMRYEVLGAKITTGQWKWGEEKARFAVDNFKEYEKSFSKKMSLEEYWVKTGKKLQFLRRNIKGKGANKGVEHWIPPAEGILRNTNWTDIFASKSEKYIDIPFDFPKNIEIFTNLFSGCVEEDDIVLDYFAGSGSFGHSVIEYNYRNRDKNLRYILINLDEPTDENSDAYKKGFKTICEITKKRLRQVNKHYKKLDKFLDGGMKLYKLYYSNYLKWKDYKSDDLEELELLFDKMGSSLVEDWSEANLLTEILLLEGFPLDSKIEEVKEYKKDKIQQVTSDFCEHKLLICLDKKVHSETINNLQLGDTDIFICLDNAITDEEKVTLSDKGLIKTI